jgi:hypothetical protein
VPEPPFKAIAEDPERALKIEPVSARKQTSSAEGVGCAQNRRPSVGPRL